MYSSTKTISNISFSLPLVKYDRNINPSFFSFSFWPIFSVKRNLKFFNDAEWNSTEALGIKEVSKQIQKIKSEGVKNQVIYMPALPLEASHYFISKGKGKGLKSAEIFIALYKPFDQALSDAKKDVSEIKDLEKQLGAAMQGISLG